MPWVPVGAPSGSGQGRRKHGRAKAQSSASADADIDWRQQAPSQQLGSQAVAQEVSSNDAESSLPVQSPNSTPPRPLSLGATKTRRMAWADMASDEESEPDFGLLSPSSPSGPPGPWSQDTAPPLEERAPAVETARAVEEPADWVAEVLVLAGRLQDLAAKAPQTARPKRFCEAAATEVSIADVDQMEAAAAELDTVRAELDEAIAEKAAADAEADEAERLFKEASAFADSHAAEAAQEAALEAEEFRGHAAEMAKACASLEAAKAASESAKRDAALHSEQRKALLEALHQKLLAGRKSAEDAEAEAARNSSARDARKALPELRKRRKASEANADKAETACKAARTSVEQLRGELAAAKEAADARVAPIESRREQLEKAVKELQQQLSAPLPADQDAAAQQAATKALEEELKAAQASNRELLEPARKARSASMSQSDMGKLQEEVEQYKAALRQATAEGTDLAQQATVLSRRESLAREEVNRLKAQIKVAEQKVQDSEEAAKRDRERHSEIETAKRGLQISRRRIEEAATVLEWRLQKAAMQLEKDQPGTSLVRHLLHGDGKASIGLQRPPRSKRYSVSGTNAGGSDADLESTTAASETVAEC
mmetsp:Transcript_97688/g.174027  ORF Transcript_97688/g.174027 Transcript_97688/m.174027 type:complete len:603 (+) Transcript_97688:108-1916(+)